MESRQFRVEKFKVWRRNGQGCFQGVLKHLRCSVVVGVLFCSTFFICSSPLSCEAAERQPKVVQICNFSALKYSSGEDCRLENVNNMKAQVQLCYIFMFTFPRHNSEESLDSTHLVEKIRCHR